jgi:hypothetical protein
VGEAVGSASIDAQNISAAYHLFACAARCLARSSPDKIASDKLGKVNPLSHSACLDGGNPSGGAGGTHSVNPSTSFNGWFASPHTRSHHLPHNAPGSTFVSTGPWVGAGAETSQKQS